MDVHNFDEKSNPFSGGTSGVSGMDKNNNFWRNLGVLLAGRRIPSKSDDKGVNLKETLKSKDGKEYAFVRSGQIILVEPRKPWNNKSERKQYKRDCRHESDE